MIFTVHIGGVYETLWILRPSTSVRSTKHPPSQTWE